MEKIKYLPLGLFFSATLKSLINPPSYADISLILVLGVISAFYEFKTQEKKFEELKNQLKELNSKFLEVQASQDEVKGYVSGIKLNQQMRGQVSVNNNR